MYADWTNQFEQMIRYAFAFALVFMFWPKLLFRRTGGDLAERLTTRFILMTLLLILMGYALVTARLFEVLAILPVLGLIAARRYILGIVKGRNGKEANPESAVKFYDWLEGKYNPWTDVKALIRRKLREGFRELRERARQTRTWVESSLLTAVFAVSGYIRFYDAWTHAAPAMSDGYVTLAWIKYIDQRILFHDGIYPQGFHIWMDYLVKFAVTDPLYILKYTGPLNAMLLMAGMYLAVSRWTGSRAAGILTVTVYGLLGAWISGGAYERQASTNSQEFAFIFVIPTLYFLHRWLRDRLRWALTAGIAGMVAVGLIHTLAYVFLGMGVALLLFIYLPLTMRERFRPLWPIIGGGAASVLVSAAPLGLGLLLGRTVHSSSEDFATSRNEFTSLPDLRPVDIAALVAVTIIVVWTIRHLRVIRQFTGPIFACLFVGATFAIYYFGNLFTFPGSTVVTSRSTDLWSIMLPIGIGTAAGLLFRMMERIRVSRYFGISAVTLTVVAILILAPPRPIVPYKMEWDSGVEQYLRISSQYRPKTWMIVSHAREGYSIVLGSGHHMDISEFMNTYDPIRWPLAKYGASAYDRKIAKDIFIYYEKNIYRVSESNAIFPLMKPEYDHIEHELEHLDEWLSSHRSVNEGLSVWYEDKNLRIYHLRQPEDDIERFERIWGEEAASS